MRQTPKALQTERTLRPFSVAQRFGIGPRLACRLGGRAADMSRASHEVEMRSTTCLLT
jgi:hypothetical protein